MEWQTRRVFLRAVGGALGGSALVRPVQGTNAREHSFDPNVHGFGFRNWSTRTPVYPEHDHDEIDEQQVKQLITTRWHNRLRRGVGIELGQFSDALVEAISKQLYVSVNQLSASNGHCYGMVYAAQSCYETPETLPANRASAGEITSPGEQLRGGDAVGKRIDTLHIQQFLDPLAWIGRRAMATPRRIDYNAQLRNVAAVIDEFGTAGLTVVNSETKGSHQVLAYEYRERDGEIALPIYDPNQHAGTYGDGQSPQIVVDTSGDRPQVVPFTTPYLSTGYDAFLFNRFDRISQARNAADSFNHVEGMTAEPEPEFSRLAVFLTDTSNVQLAVVDPSGTPVTRPTSPYLDRRRTTYRAMRYRYGAPAGDYRVTITGQTAGEYGLEMLAADGDGELFRSRTEDAIEPGQVHTYTVTIPETAAEDGTVTHRDDGTDWVVPAASAGVAGLGGIAAGLYVGRRRSEATSEVE